MAEQLVFIGDSLTEWFDWQKRFPAFDVLNLGVSGETVEGLLARRGRIRSQISDPAHIFLMTGINNALGGGYDIAEPYRELVRSFAAWYRTAVIVVQSLLPVEFSGISNDLLRDVNRRLRETALTEHAEYLDVFSAFVDAGGRPMPGYLSDDGVHLTGRGYTVWAGEVERFLKNTAAPQRQRR